MIVALSGKINSGKDLVGKIIQYLIADHKSDNPLAYSIEAFVKGNDIYNTNYVKDYTESISGDSGWQIKKFADKLKDIVCILIGCTREQLEDREFKEKELGEEWWYWKENITGKITKSYTGHEINDYILVKLTPRLLLQLVGTECMRNIIHPDTWVNALMTEYKQEPYFGPDTENYAYDILEFYPNWIITDMRFPNELQAVKDKSGISIKVNRPSVILDGIGYNAGDHPSETALDHINDWDYVIDNDGSIEDLIIKVKEILIQAEILN